MNSSLLATKLRRPSIPHKWVQRTRLVERLNGGIETGRQVTLVSAPAGFGKTTCIAEWLSTLDYAVAWLSLDAADDDPGRFFGYLAAALQTVDASLGREIAGALRAGQIPPGDVIASGLVNDILKVQRRFLLILDDFHVIQDRFILQVLDRLVANLPPALHLVLITREDPTLPLARLRANNGLTEIRASDLRFTSHEAARFLDQVMGLSLSPADVAALDGKTEGWIVGLQLAALSVRDRSDPSGFIAALSGSHRFILSYLTEQVLGQQPQEIQQFLLQTSILDRLSGPLCNAVTGHTDSQLMLERLFRGNLFLIPLDDEQHWYRYHHLFADLLRHRLEALHPDQVADLNRRASMWYAESSPGEGGAFAGEAVRHALAASDYALALQLVESQAMGMIMYGYFKTVGGWMQAIPAQWRAQSIRANLAFAWMHSLRGSVAQAAPYLEQLQAVFSGAQAGTEGTSLQAQWLALQSAVRNTQQRPQEGLALANRALEIVPEDDHYSRSLIYLARAGACQLTDDYAGAAEAFQRIAHHGRAAANVELEAVGTAGEAGMALRQGQLHLAFEVASRGVDIIERSGAVPPTSASVYGSLGQVYYQWNQLDPAHRAYQRAIQVSRLSGYSDVEICYLAIRSRLHEVEGNLEAAAAEIQEALDLLKRGAAAWVPAEVISQQVRVYLAQDNPAAAETALRQSGVALEDEVTHQTDLFHLAYLRLMLYRGQARRDGSLRDANDLARRILSSAQAGRRALTILQASILAALVQAVHGDVAGGLKYLECALGQAEPEGYLRLFVDEGSPIAALLRQAQLQGMHPDYVRELLALLSSPAAGPEPHSDGAGLVEPLTARELEILCLIREGYSNQEIARRLVITLHTVKKHNSNIFTKLGVGSRTQAVARARQLGLL